MGPRTTCLWAARPLKLLGPNTPAGKEAVRSADTSIGTRALERLKGLSIVKLAVYGPDLLGYSVCTAS